MTLNSKIKHSVKEKRQAVHIESSHEHKGVPKKKATAIAWATVEKQSRAGEDPGSNKPDPNSLEAQTKVELLAMARLRHVRGRSNMSKHELILALRKNNLKNTSGTLSSEQPQVSY